MYQVVMTADGRNTIVFVSLSEKSAQKRAAKLRAAEQDANVGYCVVQGSVTSTDHKTSQITRHN